MENTLRDKLRIGMTYEELVELLGEPTAVTSGDDVLDGAGRVVGSPKAISAIRGTSFPCWKREGAEYYLTLVDGKLARIHSILRPWPKDD
jgi:hypothetical protein